MRQQMPQEYFWDPKEGVSKWMALGKRFLYIVSYTWLSSDHPDPQCYHLSRLVCILKALKIHYSKYGVEEVGVALDFCSLWQKDANGAMEDLRTTAQKQAFLEGLGGFNDMY